MTQINLVLNMKSVLIIFTSSFGILLGPLISNSRILSDAIAARLLLPQRKSISAKLLTNALQTMISISCKNHIKHYQKWKDKQNTPKDALFLKIIFIYKCCSASDITSERQHLRALKTILSSSTFKKNG